MSTTQSESDRVVAHRMSPLVAENRGAHTLSRVTFMGEGEHTRGKPEQATPQAGRAPIDDEGRYRQI
jgi:hypothetical protein